MDIQSIGYVLIGALVCFSGYSMFRSMMPLWGFVLVGWITMTLIPIFIEVPAEQALFLRIGAFILGGIVGALIAMPLYYVIVFLSGAALGALVGIMVGAVLELGSPSIQSLQAFSVITFPPQPHTTLQFFLMIILGLILGGLAIGFQKFMITASSAFIGSGALVGGLSGAITRQVDISTSGILIFTGWFLLGFLGLFVQYRFMGDEV